MYYDILFLGPVAVVAASTRHLPYFLSIPIARSFCTTVEAALLRLPSSSEVQLHIPGCSGHDTLQKYLFYGPVPSSLPPSSPAPATVPPIHSTAMPPATPHTLTNLTLTDQPLFKRPCEHRR